MQIIKLYNNSKGIIVVIVIFLWMLIFVGHYECPCNKPTTNCHRLEFYGMQFNHFFFFIFLGFCFPSYFFTLQFCGILFEIIEIYLDQYERFTIKYLGGCYSPNPYPDKPNPPYYYKVWRNEPKYLHPIDKAFQLKPSTIHSFNGSIAEIIPNILGFGVGWIINKFIFI